MDRTANIIGWDNGGGLSRDIDVLLEALGECGWRVAINGRGTRSRDRSLWMRALGRARRKALVATTSKGLIAPRFALNLHLEDVSGEYVPLARRNVLIPNQEWIREASFSRLNSVDEVWAKTQLAQRLFADLGCRVRLLGWRGNERSGAGSTAGKSLCGLHIAGSSLWKGTERVLDVWSENPGWPLLRVLRRTIGYDGQPLPWRDRAPAENIQIITERVEERALMKLQNESALHLCPSEAEGFGHVILEAMSTAALVLTTDAPPMNEIITSRNGLLVSVERSDRMSLGERYFVSRRDLRDKISAALSMDAREREALGRAARASFELNNATFLTKLRECLRGIAPQTAVKA